MTELTKNLIDSIQRTFQTLVLFDRRVNKYEQQLVEAIQSDPRIEVVRLQVRRYMKTDRSAFIASRGGQMAKLMLLFEFKCPCGDTRREVFSLPLKWKQPDEMSKTTKFLSTFTYNHLKSEGFVE